MADHSRAGRMPVKRCNTTGVSLLLSEFQVIIFAHFSDQVVDSGAIVRDLQCIWFEGNPQFIFRNSPGFEAGGNDGKSEGFKGPNTCNMVRFAYPSMTPHNRHCLQVLLHSGCISTIIGIGTDVLQWATWLEWYISISSSWLTKDSFDLHEIRRWY